jgi:hypothetical protein
MTNYIIAHVILYDINLKKYIDRDNVGLTKKGGKKQKSPEKLKNRAKTKNPSQKPKENVYYMGV